MASTAAPKLLFCCLIDSILVRWIGKQQQKYENNRCLCNTSQLVQFQFFNTIDSLNISPLDWRLCYLLLILKLTVLSKVQFVSWNLAVFIWDFTTISRLFPIYQSQAISEITPGVSHGKVLKSEILKIKFPYTYVGTNICILITFETFTHCI